MKTFLFVALFAALIPRAFADTPPPGTVKAKTWSGDGVTSINATGNSLDVQVTGSALPTNACKETGGNLAAILTELQGTLTVAPLGGSMTVDQGHPGPTASPWPVSIQGSSTITGTVNQGTPGPTASPWPVVQQGTVTVDGSGHTQPISAVSLPLPTGASTSAKQPALGTAGTPSSDVITVQGKSGMTAVVVDGSGVTQPVSGTFWQATQPVSAASLPLPSGAATAAKQPALGTAGSASSDVITVQGIASMTALKVDGSAVTQPVSGTFWQATQPVSAASLPLPSGASTAAKQPALGTAGTPSSDVITVQGKSGMTALVVDGSGVTQPVSGTFWQATQPVSAASLPLPSGASTAAKQPALGTAGTASSDVITVQGIASMTALKVDGSAVTQPVSGTFWQTTQPVSLASLPALVAGTAVIGKVGIDQTTPGTTNGVQVNAALPAGTNVIGKVSIDQTTPGTTNLVALAANQSVNLNQIAGNSTSTGNGTAGTGVQRVTIASDNTAFSVNAAARTPTALTVKQAAVTIGTSAVRLTNDGSAPASTRVLLVVQLLSTSTANCYFGSSGVTTTSTTRGVQFFAGQILSFNNDAGDYYGICDASSQTVLITEQE